MSRSRQLDLSNLIVWTPPPKYLLAMKAIAARFDSGDAQGLRTLVRHFGLVRVEQVLEIVQRCKLEGANEDRTVGIRLLARSIEEPPRQIVGNAGEDAAAGAINSTVTDMLTFVRANMAASSESPASELSRAMATAHAPRIETKRLD